MGPNNKRFDASPRPLRIDNTVVRIKAWVDNCLAVLLFHDYSSDDRYSQIDDDWAINQSVLLGQLI